MQGNPEIVLAIMAIFGVGVIGVVEFIKRILKTEGQTIVNFVITGAVSFAATAAYLLKADLFSIGALILYGVIVFGEASGLYHVYAKNKTG